MEIMLSLSSSKDKNFFKNERMDGAKKTRHFTFQEIGSRHDLSTSPLEAKKRKGKTLIGSFATHTRKGPELT
jgi:hypothetical protein